MNEKNVKEIWYTILYCVCEDFCDSILLRFRFRNTAGNANSHFLQNSVRNPQAQYLIFGFFELIFFSSYLFNFFIHL
jgi:hypothetical protein